MQLEPDEVEESLDRLRALGAVGLVEGYGRVAKVPPLSLRMAGGGQGRAGGDDRTALPRRPDGRGSCAAGRRRMEPIADLAALRPVLDSLKAKGLVCR